MSAVALNLTGCAAVKGIFKAGIWVGVVLAIFAMVGVLALMRTFSRH